VVDTMLRMGKSSSRDMSASLYLMTLGVSSVTDIEGRTRLGRDGSPPEITTEPILRFDDARYSSTEWPFMGFMGEQVDEAVLGRDGVCAQGLVRSSVILHVPSGASR
jgi:hypothetical protein